MCRSVLGRLMLGAVAASPSAPRRPAPRSLPGPRASATPSSRAPATAGYDVAHYDIDLNYIAGHEPPRRDHDDQGHRDPGPERVRPRLPRAPDHRAHRRRLPACVRASRSGARGHAVGGHPHRGGVHGRGRLPRHTAVDHRPGRLDRGLGAHGRRRVRRRRAAGLPDLVPVQRPPDGQGDLRDRDHRPAGNAGDLERHAARGARPASASTDGTTATDRGTRRSTGDVELRLAAADGDLSGDRDGRRLHDRPQARRRARITGRRRPDGGARGPREPDARPDRPHHHPLRRPLRPVSVQRRPARSSTTRRRSATRWRPRPARSSTGRAGDEITLVHELAHQWFGDSVSLEQLARHVAQRGVRDLGRVALGAGAGRPDDRPAARRPRAPAGDPPRPLGPARERDPRRQQLFATSVYTRGAMALEALRQRVGDATFYDILRTWAAEHAFGREHGGVHRPRRDSRASSSTTSSPSTCSSRASPRARAPRTPQAPAPLHEVA